MENNIKISKLKKVQLDNKKFLKKIDYQQAEGREKSNKLEKQKLKFEEIYKEKMKQKERRELQFQLEQ